MILNRGLDAMRPVPLADAGPSGTYYVDNVSGPEQQRLRLCEMGIVSGASVAVLSRGKEGMLVVKVGGSRLALSRGMTEHVWVQRPPPR